MGEHGPRTAGQVALLKRPGAGYPGKASTGAGFRLKYSFLGQAIKNPATRAGLVEQLRESLGGQLFALGLPGLGPGR